MIDKKDEMKEKSAKKINNGLDHVEGKN